MKYNYSIIKYVGRIKHLIREPVFLFNIKAFTYIEALFALFVTTLILALLPIILKLTSFYLNTAQNNEDIQFEFFRRDLLKEKMTTKNNYEIENAYTIKLKKNKDVIRYIYKNRKIYKNINQRGNITLLNHVLSTRILKTNDNIVKLLITTGDANDKHKEILFL
ncbi:competence type IV pilus minor pilin ComGF [Staphylococcus epidermidis]|uniref:competence type IV pilus minor pilin ComGF n=1 Tax=Staphylococcus epidermidis TaxID=1282 RepID=UPI0016433D0F|nr:competence type IV pilus minor pilin ComGF [Staphylococcus epidermidis]